MVFHSPLLPFQTQLYLIFCARGHSCLQAGVDCWVSEEWRPGDESTRVANRTHPHPSQGQRQILSQIIVLNSAPIKTEVSFFCDRRSCKICVNVPEKNTFSCIICIEVQNLYTLIVILLWNYSYFTNLVRFKQTNYRYLCICVILLSWAKIIAICALLMCHFFCWQIPCLASSHMYTPPAKTNMVYFQQKGSFSLTWTSNFFWQIWHSLCQPLVPNKSWTSGKKKWAI